MIVSLNEIESLVLKAARGAGLAWGLAEEAAAAAVWLARADLLLIGPLLSRLEVVQTASLPVLVDQTIQPATSGPALCPILTGAWIADQRFAGRQLEVRNVVAPLWLSAIVARALPRDCQLVAAWQDARLVLDRFGPHRPIDRETSNVSAETAASVSLMCRQRADGQHAPPPRASGGIVVRDADWRALQNFEQRTYVPASERSRFAGAGAGLLDSD